MTHFEKKKTPPTCDPFEKGKKANFFSNITYGDVRDVFSFRVTRGSLAKNLMQKKKNTPFYIFSKGVLFSMFGKKFC